MLENNILELQISINSLPTKVELTLYGYDKINDVFYIEYKNLETSKRSRAILEYKQDKNNTLLVKDDYRLAQIFPSKKKNDNSIEALEDYKKSVREYFNHLNILNLSDFNQKYIPTVIEYEHILPDGTKEKREKIYNYYNNINNKKDVNVTVFRYNGSNYLNLDDGYKLNLNKEFIFGAFFKPSQNDLISTGANITYKDVPVQREIVIKIYYDNDSYYISSNIAKLLKLEVNDNNAITKVDKIKLNKIIDTSKNSIVRINPRFIEKDLALKDIKIFVLGNNLGVTLDDANKFNINSYDTFNFAGNKYIKISENQIKEIEKQYNIPSKVIELSL